ncbi:unnamed protein product, partial [Candidula unifasciata]
MDNDWDRSEPQVNITFEDMGIPTTRRLHFSIIGETRSCSEIGLTDRVYTSLVLLSVAAAAIPTVCQLAMSGAHSDDYTLGLVLLINEVFSVWYILEGVLKERSPEIAVLTLSVALNMAYVGVSYTSGHRSSFTLARLTVTAVFCPVLVIPGIGIICTYYVSRRLIFRTVGANASLQAFYLTLLLFQDLLKLDLQLGVSSILFAITLTRPIATQDITLLSVGVTFAAAWSALGLWAMPRESKVGAYLFFIFCPAQIAYLTYRLLLHKAAITSGNVEGTSPEVICFVAALTVHIGVILTGILVFARFGHGLKDKCKILSS